MSPDPTVPSPPKVVPAVVPPAVAPGVEDGYDETTVNRDTKRYKRILGRASKKYVQKHVE